MKTRYLILCFFLISLFLVGCKNNTTAGVDTPRNELRMGVSPEFSPFEFIDESNNMTGFDIELMHILAEEMGVKLNMVAMTWDGLIPALQSGSIDGVISGMTVTEERAKTVTFSDPYYRSGLLIMTKSSNNNIQSIDDLRGKKIAVQIGTTGAIRASKIPEARIIEFNNSPDAVLELKNNNVDAVISDAPVLSFYMSQTKDSDVKIVGDIMDAEFYAIAVKNGNLDVISSINAALASVKENGKYDALYNRWFATTYDRTDIKDTLFSSLPFLLKGSVITLELTSMSVLIGFFIGIFVGVGRISPLKYIKIPCAIYIDFIRGTPLLVQIFLIYFGLPNLLNINVHPFAAAITACGINSGAYVAEIVRSGIQSIDKGQMEAGRSLGMSYMQTMTSIIFPQAFKRILPPLGNEFIAMLKDSSLVAVIGIGELTRQGQLIISRNYKSFEIWIMVAIIYLIMTLTISRVVAYLEKRYHTS